ncbi:cob(I)yrinic acid a,c-diamide adenosyltransferase [Lutibacter sp. HS1-25]|uniref:cob(I)yrinic acid a,c-diamide adenosyltransferase n=1 Tax=Lutibacter sp. HS1-25 TaxID=2485000 RepID=UPI0010123D06|nr:cob(I)yrinic acid a,c-diamide adenosyltransferase [Lutibacter sp. HS1-25]RXP47087.1 cob(I)yrinic acid a,c-diamide adenosyltransferase [Lutibacter sp. HS1-25]
MKIYTKTGDKGQTSLFGGTRVPKYNIRIEAYGTTDELNAYIGLLRDQDINNHIKEILLKIQHDLFTLGAMLATPPEKELLKSGKERLKIEKINEAKIELLENEIDAMNEELPPMTHFVLPGGNPIVSYCHIARCICRRAERITTQLSDESTVNPQILMYLNRLSDYLFVLARKLTYDTKSLEIKWIPEKEN